MSVTITLDAESERLIAALLRDGRYASAEDAVREALRALEAEAAVDAMLEGLDVAAIRESIEESRRSGVLYSAEEVFGRLEAKYAALAA
ncbi:MAG: type II toxin-antitoxin system ParD family antitoxin, partial [Acetobacteraceae bacterium]|nr:type II toxin-antitoxin system ParD family antitoxin [Acetobacteraceae bacterium]